jgi:phage tail-like protein
MAQSEFPNNPHRTDPFKNFKFVVKFDGKDPPVAGVSKVSPLKRTTQVVTHREGGDPSTPRHSPGTTAFEPITMERGITFDPEFETWANRVHNVKGEDKMSLKDYKRDILIEVKNLQNKPVKRYKVVRAWVSEYTALPELDANGNATLIESIVIQNEGWERQDELKEPVET